MFILTLIFLISCGNNSVNDVDKNVEISSNNVLNLAKKCNIVSIQSCHSM